MLHLTAQRLEGDCSARFCDDVGHHALAPLGIRALPHADLCHIRRCSECSLDDEGVHLLATGHDHLIDATNHRNGAISGNSPRIPRDEPTGGAVRADGEGLGAIAVGAQLRWALDEEATSCWVDGNGDISQGAAVVDDA